MHLANGGFLPWFVAGFVLLSALVLISQAKREGILASFFRKAGGSASLSLFDLRLRRVRLGLLIGALFFCGFAALDPRWGSRQVETQLEGIDAVFLMDVSLSMRTPDVAPDRLENSKKLSVQLMSLLAGNRVGLAAFAGYGFQVSPLSTDAEAVAMFLSELGPDMVDVQGSNLEDAIRKALGLFQKEALTHKAIVLFTDGEDTEFQPMKAAKEARDQGVTIFPVSLGTPNGLPVPLLDENGNLTNYQRDENGAQIVSRLNEKLLSDIAAMTGGIVVPGNPGGMIELSRRLDTMNKARFGSDVYEFMEPQFQYFLAIGILLLLIALFLPERRLKLSAVKSAALLLFLLALPSVLSASDASRASAEWKKGDFDASLRDFQKALVQDPKNDRLLFNQGGAFLGLTNYAAAADSWARLTNSADPDVRLRSAYNLGAASLEKKDYGKAIEQYGRILSESPEKNPYYRNSLLNFLYAKEQLKEQQKQQKQQQNQNGTNQQQQKDQQDKKNGNDPKNGKQSQDQQKSDPSMKPVTPSEAENLLNLIAQEEKKHFGKKEARSGMRVNPKNPW